MPDRPRPSVKLVVYLLDVENTAEVDAVADEVADVLAKRWRRADGVHAIVAAQAWDVPMADAELIQEVGRDAAFLLIPEGKPGGRLHRHRVRWARLYMSSRSFLASLAPDWRRDA